MCFYLMNYINLKSFSFHGFLPIKSIQIFAKNSFLQSLHVIGLFSLYFGTGKKQKIDTTQIVR